ncbi:MAG: glycerol-3-phosphate acyltransferase [Mycobacterium sp.]
MPSVLAAGVAGYLLGTIPSAGIASRLASGGAVDLRVAGTGNPGAMNAMGQLGTGWGLAVLAADVAKGSCAAWLGGRLASDRGAFLAGTAAIAGHVFPVGKRFRGGKGVATSAGASLVLFPADFPLDAGVAALSAVRSANADRAIEVSSLVWALAAGLWWRKRWPNAWGPPPSAGLLLFAASSALMMIVRVELGRRRGR